MVVVEVYNNMVVYIIYLVDLCSRPRWYRKVENVYWNNVGIGDRRMNFCALFTSFSSNWAKWCHEEYLGHQHDILSYLLQGRSFLEISEIVTAWNDPKVVMTSGDDTATRT